MMRWCRIIMEVSDRVLSIEGERKDWKDVLVCKVPLSSSRPCWCQSGVQAHSRGCGETREAHEGVAACSHISEQGLQVIELAIIIIWWGWWCWCGYVHWFGETLICKMTMIRMMFWYDWLLLSLPSCAKDLVISMIILISSEPKKRDMWLKIWFSALEAVEGEVVFVKRKTTAKG